MLGAAHAKLAEGIVLHAGARIGESIALHSGIAFYPFDPRLDEIRIEDIAHALACQNRFGGHTRWPYSVAQHCVLASQIVPPEHAFAALMHDAAETYLIDLPRPLKRAPGFATYRALEAVLTGAIADRFNLPADYTAIPAVLHADDVLLATEKRDLMNPCAVARMTNLPPPHAMRITPWTWREAELSFLARFGALHT